MDGNVLLMPDHYLGRERSPRWRVARTRYQHPDIRYGSSCAGDAAYSWGRFHWMLILLPVTDANSPLEGDVPHRQIRSSGYADACDAPCPDTRASMHVFNDNGWFIAAVRSRATRAHVYSGFRYQVIDIKVFRPIR